MAKSNEFEILWELFRKEYPSLYDDIEEHKFIIEGFFLRGVAVERNGIEALLQILYHDHENQDVGAEEWPETIQ